MSALGPEPQTKRKCLAKATAHGSRAGSKFETGVSGAAGRLSSTSSTILCVCVGALFVDFVNCEVNTNVFIIPVMSSLHSSGTKQSARLVILLKFVIAEPLQICINRE
jgi:hypothetical protein